DPRGSPHGPADRPMRPDHRRGARRLDARPGRRRRIAMNADEERELPERGADAAGARAKRGGDGKAEASARKLGSTLPDMRAGYVTPDGGESMDAPVRPTLGGRAPGVTPVRT